MKHLKLFIFALMAKQENTSKDRLNERLKINAPFEEAMKVLLKNDAGTIKKPESTKKTKKD